MKQKSQKIILWINKLALKNILEKGHLEIADEEPSESERQSDISRICGSLFMFSGMILMLLMPLFAFISMSLGGGFYIAFFPGIFLLSIGFIFIMKLALKEQAIKSKKMSLNSKRFASYDSDFLHGFLYSLIAMLFIYLISSS